MRRGREAAANAKKYVVENSEKRGIIKGMGDKSISMGRLYMSTDKYKHIASFKQLEMPQTLEEVSRIADKYNIDVSNYNIFLRMDEELLNIEIGLTGGSFDNNEIDLYPLAFVNEETLARTLFHEVYHQKQYTLHGQDNVIANHTKYETITVEVEKDWWEKKRWMK